MPTSCSAYGCTNYFTKKGCRERNVSFHSFPLSNKVLMSEWLAKIKRENFVPTRSTKICSDHFEESCFEFQNFTNRRQLKKDAVPTKFSFVSPKVPRKRTKYSFDNVARSSDYSLEESSVVSINKETQTDVSFLQLIQESYLKDEEIKSLKELLGKWFSPEDMTDAQLRTLSGFNKETFFKIFNFLNLKDDLETYGNKMTASRQYFLFLLKLRTGVTIDFLSYIFQLSSATVSRNFNKITDVIYHKLQAIPIWPDRDQVTEFMPIQFRARYPNCRVIIDCTEIEIQKVFNPKQQQLTFSYYKNANTVKALIGISPSGALSYISDLWCGSISDKAMFLRSRLPHLLEANDLVLADKGFQIAKELSDIDCELATPLYLREKIQFTLKERALNKSISHLRVHVERAISRIKIFRYFDTAIPYNSLHNLNEVFYIAAFLTNFFNPLITNTIASTNDAL